MAAKPATFYLKLNDTQPALRVQLLNPDGTVFDLGGTNTYALHVRLTSGETFSAAMTKVGADADGTLQYLWQDEDWATLIAGRHQMEYEVLGDAGFRATFPNKGYDVLWIDADLGQEE